MTKRTLQLLMICTLILSLGAVASADTQYNASLDGTQSGTGSVATGTATLILNTAETEATYTITFTGLEGTETAAHFHMAPPGTNGGVVEALPMGSPKTGTWAVTPAEVTALQAGNIYVNIHSTIYAGGEIRDWLSFTAVAADESSWGDIKNDYR